MPFVTVQVFRDPVCEELFAELLSISLDQVRHVLFQRGRQYTPEGDWLAFFATDRGEVGHAGLAVRIREKLRRTEVLLQALESNSSSMPDMDVVRRAYGQYLDIAGYAVLGMVDLSRKLALLQFEQEAQKGDEEQ